jgi:hypothetical protein
VTGSLHLTARYSIKPTLACTGAVVAASIVATMAIPPFVRLATPAFAGAIPLTQVLVWSGLYPALMLPKVAFVAGRRNVPVTVGSLACFGSFLILGLVACWMAWPPVTIALAFLAGKLANVVVCYLWLWRDASGPEPAASLADR